ncbi:hypothetical protein SARC_12751 [Sphaeroforma arctica JP610]|uniref:Ubiquitin thioesterase OTU n=1 Tax=Sphaeroforma arctica JP610 TaxID=667725 RepID=A0A0L0FF84_9EUKA|nr:hypothetical protein SARC_12751 [Sphaeroforma arctica JP610]KNC74708.1 hypothetical protein SARC_12751 [Sphaeroforma arctica JP610]|eukprot:XP_014148610.1 hypothetical protein SARC_12751 [Sphaeroforma arctica JP610]
MGSGTHTISDLSGTSTISDLMNSLATIADCDKSLLKVMYSYPPKKLSTVDDATLESIPITSGETFIVEQSQTEEEKNRTKFTTDSNTGYRTVRNDNLMSADTSNSSGEIIRRVVPDDNSCLFSSIAKNLLRDSTQSGQLRSIVANAIVVDTTTYNEAMLGQSVDDYVRWIQNPDSWGGAIDISILAEFFHTEIVVCDTQTLRMDRFGQEKNYASRILIIYDGVHYDALAITPYMGAPHDQDITVFESSDDGILKKALQLTTSEHKRGKFTDLAGFTIRCSDCQKGLKGQKDAQVHATSTGHTRFEEYR